MDEETRILQKIRTKHQTIFKNGTYNIVREPVEEETPDDSMSALDQDKIAEIMNKFTNNIQNNVSDLFNQ